MQTPPGGHLLWGPFAMAKAYTYIPVTGSHTVPAGHELLANNSNKDTTEKTSQLVLPFLGDFKEKKRRTNYLKVFFFNYEAIFFPQKL